ncbi:hypothetical protein OQX61_23965 [Pedobacter sp. PLR]|uniref:hypothetical protein n=1 Tax=Pedobacter sp. PLR TaxID=2994465 RepID=UPI0022453D16|nr:hypothetical protein [Pedobacter sp. PLR]MCX2454348.1 hypothetical protein [Pedobacter sp. PLR]
MAEDKKYNLSIVGDFELKLIGFITAIVSFLTFIQAFINDTSTLFGIELWESYQLFILLYFIFPAGLVCYFIIQKSNFITKKIIGIEVGYNQSLLQIILFLLFFIFGFFYLRSTDPTTINIGLYIAILLITPIYFITVFQIGKMAWKHKFQSEAKEYIIVTLVLLILIISFMLNSFESLTNKNSSHEKSAKKLLTEYHNQILYNTTLNKIAREIAERSSENMATIKLYSFKEGYVMPQSSRTLMNGVISKVDTGLKHSLTNAKNLLYTKNHNNTAAIISVKKLLDKQAKQLLDLFNTPNIDSTAVANINKKLALYADYSNQIDSTWRDYVATKEKDFNKEWLPHVQVLQFKGLLWLFFFLILLFTILYHYRKQSILIQKEDYKNKIKQDANLLKNYVFLFVLLIMPFFKKFTEENINFKKPFLNIGIKELLKTEKQNTIEPNSNAKNKSNLVDSTHTTIEVIIDTNSLKQLNHEVLEKIKKLGKKAIDNPTDRKKFLEDFDKP